MKKIIVTLMFLLASFNASADLESVSGKLNGYNITQHNGQSVFLFQMKDIRTGGCNTTGRFAVNKNSPLFEGTQAAVMAAYHSNSDVRVFYSTFSNSSCTAHNNSADFLWLCVGDIGC